MSTSKIPRGTRSRRLAAVGLALGMVLTVGACGRSSGSSGQSGDNDNGGTEKNAEMVGGPGVDLKTKTITLGALTPVSTIAKLIGDPLTSGNKVFFDQLNDSGGIDGWKIEMKVADNKYGGGDNTATATAYGQIKGDVAAFTQVLGTDPLNSIIPQLEDDNIVASPATLDAEWYEEPNLLAIMGPYQVQMANALWYYLNKMDGKGKTYCTMSSDDGYGNAGLNGVKFAADQLDVKITDSEKFTTSASGGSYDAQVSTLQQKKCDVVFLTSLPTDTNGIFNTAVSKKFSPQWIGTAPTWINILAQGDMGAYSAEHYLVAAEGVPWGDTSSAGMKQLIAAVKKYAPDTSPDFYFAFGYMQAKAMSQVLAKAVEDNDLSRDGIMNAMNNVGTLTFDGMVADEPYGKVDDRKPQRESTLFKVTPDTLKSNGALTPVADDAVNFTSDVAKKVPLTN